MKAEKYYDWSKRKTLTIQDGCEFGKWARPTDSIRFGIHPSGIFVFLSAQEVSQLEKYRDGVVEMGNDFGSPFHNMRLETTLGLLIQFMQTKEPVNRLVDVGCGMGVLLESLQRHFPWMEVTGVDVSLQALESAAKRVPAADLVLADGSEPPFAPNYFDAVVLNNVIEHVLNPAVLLARMAQVTRPGGCIILSTPSRYRYDNLLRIARGKPVQLMARDHVTEYSVGQVEQLLARCGYTVMEVLGPKRRPARRTVRNTVSQALLKPMLRICLRFLGSRHVLEPTAFFLAQKAP